MLLVVIAGLIVLSSPKTEAPKPISLTQLVAEINNSKVSSVTVTDGNLEIVYSDNKKAVAEKEPDSSLSQTLVNLGANKDNLAKISFESKTDTGVWSWLGRKR